ncbi:hypothetical protein AMJ85_00195 [candidate division BRC1 bacterium SM23_51]|nr:MAG: hypothetical protein AMJ85_00195 [candidate division BRC1 bacterium SM23_51]
MAERQHDDHAKWFYRPTFPGMDLRMSSGAIDSRMLAEATGIDGRNEGGLRVFPGFGGESLHGIPSPEAGVTIIEEINNIQKVWYASVRKGISPDTLSGLVIFADNQTDDGKALYFAYRDSSDGSTDVVQLEDFALWDDFKPTTFEQYDVTCLGKYIYFVNAGEIDSTVSIVNATAPPYNKAYFWDFKVNDWDRYIGGWQQRLMGLLPERCLVTSVNTDRIGIPTDVFDMELAGDDKPLPPGQYTFGCELVSQKHNLRSFMRRRTYTLPDTPLYSIRYVMNNLWLSENNPTPGYHQLYRQVSNSQTAPLHWGIGHVDGFRLWRTPRNDTGITAGKYRPIQRLYEYRPYEPLLTQPSGTGIAYWRFKIQNDDAIIAPGTREIEHVDDDGLYTNDEYSAEHHDFGPAPRMKRLLGFDNMLIGVTDQATPDDTGLNESWTMQDRVPESIVWSAIHLDEPENFPVLNYEPLNDPSERVLNLYPGASVAFALTNKSVYRIARAGTGVSITRPVNNISAVSQDGAVAVGDTLYVLTATGVKEIDGNTNEVRNVKLVNRLVIDDRQWGKTLSDVKMGYDSFAGALILLNTDQKEMVILWEATGAVTRVVNCPWAFVTSGQDVLSDGVGQRCYLVTSSGVISVIDAFRESGKVTMCGAGATDTVNGQVTSASATAIIDTGATFPQDIVGHSAYILSGDCAGEKVEITARVSDTELTVGGLSGTTAVDDRYSIAPVVVHARFARLSGMGSDDPFLRKVGHSMSASIEALGGETAVSDPNAFIDMGLRTQDTVLTTNSVRVNSVPDQVNVRANRGGAKMYPFVESYGANMDYEIEALLVRGQRSASEASTRPG